MPAPDSTDVMFLELHAGEADLAGSKGGAALNIYTACLLPFHHPSSKLVSILSAVSHSFLATRDEELQPSATSQYLVTPQQQKTWGDMIGVCTCSTFVVLALNNMQALVGSQGLQTKPVRYVDDVYPERAARSEGRSLWIWNRACLS